MAVKHHNFLSKPAFLLLRSACTFTLLASLVACQTTAINTTSDTKKAAATNEATENSNLQMDLAGRHEYQLANGLKVIIKEDHRAPVAMTQIWYRVGSTDEPVDKGGISHLLEHMMFKGTTDVSSADYARLSA